MPVVSDGWQGPRRWGRIAAAGGVLAASFLGIALGLGLSQGSTQAPARSTPLTIRATRIGILKAFKNPLGHGTGSVTITANRYDSPSHNSDTP